MLSTLCHEALGLVVDTSGVTSVAEGPFLDLVRRQGIRAAADDLLLPVATPDRRAVDKQRRADTSKLKRWTCGCGIGVGVAPADFRARFLVCKGAFFRDD